MPWSMQVRHFPYAGYTLEGQFRSGFNFDPKHSANVRMEQTDIGA